MEYITEGSHAEVETNSALPLEGRLWKLQVHIQDDEILPGEDELKALFPRAKNIPEATPLPRQRAILGNHPDALAQQVHWDQIPQDWSANSETSPEKNQIYTVGTGRGDAHFQPIFTHCIPWSAQQPRRKLPAQTRRILTPAGCSSFYPIHHTPEEASG